MAMITEKSWQRYVERLSKLKGRAAELMRLWLEKNGTNDRQAMIEYAKALVDKYGEASAELAAENVEQMAAASGKKIAAARVAATVGYDILAPAINGAMKQGVAVVPQVVDRLVKQAAADTTMQNAVRYGAEWAWVPEGDSCAFCMMLASQGWQKASRAVLDGGHAEHIHANCDCEFAIRFNSSGGVRGYDPDRYKQIYDNAEGATWEDKLNSIRREQYAENREAGLALQHEQEARRDRLVDAVEEANA